MALQLRIVAAPKYLLALVILTAAMGCSGKRFRQASSSMVPTIQSNEVVLADMGAYETGDPQRWDVVVFYAPPPFSSSTGPWTMRVVGLPGESLDIRPEGIFINGQRVAQPERIAAIHYLPNAGAAPSPSAYPVKIPPFSYFVLGDNTTNCNDSRIWGVLSRTAIFGKIKGK